MKLLLYTLTLFCLIHPVGCTADAESHRLKEVRYVMGTRLEVTLYHANKAYGRECLQQAVAKAEALDRMLSNYIAESEISRLNAAAGIKQVPISPEMYRFLLVSKDLSSRTDGAFDLTVKPFIDLWQQARKRGRAPSSAELLQTGAGVGSNHFELSASQLLLQGSVHVHFDTGGIGKGYAVDQMIALLKEKNIERALINFGQSSIAAIGAPPGLSAWKVLFQFPDERPLGIVELSDQSLSASDSHGSLFEIQGTSYGHIINPSTGQAVIKRVKAAVLTASATQAEVLTKKLILRGWTDVDSKDWPDVQVYMRGAHGNLLSAEFPLQPTAAKTSE